LINLTWYLIFNLAKLSIIAADSRSAKETFNSRSNYTKYFKSIFEYAKSIATIGSSWDDILKNYGSNKKLPFEKK